MDDSSVHQERGITLAYLPKVKFTAKGETNEPRL